MKLVSYVNVSKKGNLYFKIGKKTYVILERDPQDVGSNNNYCTKVLFEADKRKEE